MTALEIGLESTTPKAVSLVRIIIGGTVKFDVTTHIDGRDFFEAKTTGICNPPPSIIRVDFADGSASWFPPVANHG